MIWTLPSAIATTVTPECSLPAGETMSEKLLPASGRQQTEFGGRRWLYHVRHIEPSNHGYPRNRQPFGQYVDEKLTDAEPQSFCRKASRTAA